MSPLQLFKIICGCALNGVQLEAPNKDMAELFALARHGLRHKKKEHLCSCRLLPSVLPLSR